MTVLSVDSHVVTHTLFDLVENGIGFASALSSLVDLSIFLVNVLFFLW